MPYGPTTLINQNDVLSKDKINSYILQVLADFISPPMAIYDKSVSDPNLTTASVTFVDMDATVGNFNLAIVTKGNPIEIGFRGEFFNATLGSQNCLEVTINGGAVGGGANGLMWTYQPVASYQYPMSFREVYTLGAGSYNVKMQWRTSAGTVALVSSCKPQFYVREL